MTIEMVTRYGAVAVLSVVSEPVTDGEVPPAPHEPIH